jgi:hypothetical protein
LSKETSQTGGRALRKLAATEDVLRRGRVRLVRLGRQGRLAGADVRGFTNLRDVYSGCMASVIDVLRDNGASELSFGSLALVPPLAKSYELVPDRPTQAQAWLESTFQDQGVQVSIADRNGALDAPVYESMIRRLGRAKKLSVLLCPVPDEGNQSDLLVRLAALYDIYLDYRMQEEGMREGPGAVLDTIPWQVQSAAVRVGPAVLGMGAIMLHGWLTGSRRGTRSIERLAHAIIEAERRA